MLGEEFHWIKRKLNDDQKKSDLEDAPVSEHNYIKRIFERDENLSA